MIAFIQRYALAGAAVLLLAVSVGAGWLKLELASERVAHSKAEAEWAAERTDAAEAAQRQAAKADAAATVYESRLAAAKRAQKVIVKEVDRVITAAPDLYARTCIDDSGMRAIASAIAGPATSDDPGSTSPAVP